MCINETAGEKDKTVCRTKFYVSSFGVKRKAFWELISDPVLRLRPGPSG